MKDLTKKIDWDKGNGLVPAIIQDIDTGAVLMLGYMDKASLAKTLKTNKVWFYSRSRQRLWMKGESSKNILKVEGIVNDCDNDSLLVKVKPAGPTCHKGDYSCFNDNQKNGKLAQLFATIQERKNKMLKGSYTASLFRAGLDKISLKVAEESLEVVQAAQQQTRVRLIQESVDLIYHLFVLLAEKGISLKEVDKEIVKREK